MTGSISAPCHLISRSQGMKKEEEEGARLRVWLSLQLRGNVDAAKLGGPFWECGQVNSEAKKLDIGWSESCYLDGRNIMFMISGKDNKVIIDLHKERWYRVELMQEPSKKNGKVKSFQLRRRSSTLAFVLSVCPFVVKTEFLPFTPLYTPFYAFICACMCLHAFKCVFMCVQLQRHTCALSVVKTEYLSVSLPFLSVSLPFLSVSIKSECNLCKNIAPLAYNPHTTHVQPVYNLHTTHVQPVYTNLHVMFHSVCTPPLHCNVPSVCILYAPICPFMPLYAPL